MSLAITIKVTSAQLVVDKTLLRQVLRTAGNEVAATARNLIRTSPPVGAKRGKRKSSAPGSAPRSLTGALARSIKVRLINNGTGVSIRSSSTGKPSWYALALEAGVANRAGSGKRSRRKRVGAPVNGFRMQPRPFLSTALAQRQESLGPRVQDALTRGIKLVRIKV